MNHNLTIGINLNNRTLTNNIPDNTTVSGLKYIAKVNDNNYIAENIINGISKAYFHYVKDGEDIDEIFYSSDGINVNKITLPIDFGTITEVDDTAELYQYITRVSHEKVYVVDEDLNKRESLDKEQIEANVDLQVRGYGLPIDSVIGFDGDEIPDGFEEVDNYSLNETQIGTWINGKTIYRKVIHTGAISSTAKSVAHNISNMGRVTNLYGICNQNSGRFYTLPRVNNENINNFVGLDIDTTDIRLLAGSDANFVDSYVIVEYIKNNE